MGTYLWRCVWAFLLLLVVAVLVGAPLGPSVASAAETICSNPAVWLCVDFEDGTTGGLIQSPDIRGSTRGQGRLWRPVSQDDVRHDAECRPDTAGRGSASGTGTPPAPQATNTTFAGTTTSRRIGSGPRSTPKTGCSPSAPGPSSGAVSPRTRLPRAIGCARPEWDNVASLPEHGARQPPDHAQGSVGAGRGPPEPRHGPTSGSGATACSRP